MRPQVLQLGDVLSDLQMLMRRLVGEKFDLELRHGRDLWLVEADVNQFEHVLVNLIVNARDAMPQGGKIILRTRNVVAAECAGFNETSLDPGDYVAIEVEDFGHGIAPEVKDKIFEPFFTTKEVGKGTGLGLAMVYGIVKQTGGYVFCSSTVGKGTVFTILLPQYIPDETHPPVPSNKRPRRPPISLAMARSFLSRTKGRSGLSERGLLPRAAIPSCRRPRAARRCKSPNKTAEKSSCRF